MKEKKVQIGVFSLSMLSMATLVMSPVMGLIVQAFPEEGINQVQMILAVANLTGLIAAFVVGRLALTLSKRRIALMGAFGTGFFGLLPYFFHQSLLLLIICSGLVGVSVGFITNVIPGLIADHFPIGARQEAMGKQVAFVSIGTMLLMYLSGSLGAVQWYNSYLTYLLAGVVFIIAFFCLPKGAVPKQAGGQSQHSLLEVLDKRVLSVALFGFCFLVINNVYNNNLSIFIQEEQLGSSDIAGLVSMLGQFGGLAAGFLMGRVAKRVKTQMITLAFAVEGAALILIAFSTNLPLLFTASFLTGAGLSIFFAQAPFLITILVQPILIPMGMAVLSTANSLGGFLSPTIVNTLNQLLLGATAQGALLIGGGLSLIVAVVAWLSNFQKKCLQKPVAEKEG